MKVILTKASEWEIDTNNPPHPKAELKEYTRTDSRSVATIEEGRTHFWFNDWFANGVNHREEDGCIVCDRIKKDKAWVIETNEFGDIQTLFDELGCIIIRSSWWAKEYPITIEIYDDYRE